MSNHVADYLRRVAMEAGATHFHEVILGLLPLLLGGQLLLWLVLLPVGLRGDADFAMFYTAGAMVRAGYSHQLYDYDVETRFQNALVSKTPAPYTHLPYEALLFAPVSILPYRAAYLAFVLVNLGLLVLAAWLIQVRIEHKWLSAAIFVAYFPISAAATDGQDSIILLLISAIVWLLFSRGQEWVAGGLLALGLFRFQIVLPIAGLMFLWKRWRFVAGFAVGTGAVLGLSTWVAGINQMRIYGKHLLSLGAVAAQEGGYSLSRSQYRRMVNLRALFASALPGTHVPEIVTLIASLALLVWVAKRGRAIGRKYQFALAVAFSVLVSYHLFVYDLTILLIPMMAALGLTEQRESREAKVAVLIPLLAVPVGLLYHPFLMTVPLLAFLWAVTRAFDTQTRSGTGELVNSESCSAVGSLSLPG